MSSFVWKIAQSFFLFTTVMQYLFIWPLHFLELLITGMFVFSACYLLSFALRFSLINIIKSFEKHLSHTKGNKYCLLYLLQVNTNIRYLFTLKQETTIPNSIFDHFKYLCRVETMKHDEFIQVSCS